MGIKRDVNNPKAFGYSVDHDERSAVKAHYRVNQNVRLFSEHASYKIGIKKTVMKLGIVPRLDMYENT